MKEIIVDGEREGKHQGGRMERWRKEGNREYGGMIEEGKTKTRNTVPFIP